MPNVAPHGHRVVPGPPSPPAEPRPPRAGSRTTGPAPRILLVNAAHDPRTGLAGAQAVAARLHAPLIVVAGDQHLTTQSGDACVNEAVTGFLINDAKPPASCA
jgi:hypothetical protein